MAKGSSIRRHEEPIEKEELRYHRLHQGRNEEITKTYRDYLMTVLLQHSADQGKDKLYWFLRFCDANGLLDEAVESYKEFHRPGFDINVIDP